MPAPRTTKAWRVEGTGSLDCLKFHKELALPELSDNDVLVKFHAASLNYRDLIIPIVTMPSCISSTVIYLVWQGHYPFPVAPNVIPGSDGAGEVVAVGSKVTRFEQGAKGFDTGDYYIPILCARSDNAVRLPYYLLAYFRMFIDPNSLRDTLRAKCLTKLDPRQPRKSHKN